MTLPRGFGNSEGGTCPKCKKYFTSYLARKQHIEDHNKTRQIVLPIKQMHLGLVIWFSVVIPSFIFMTNALNPWDSEHSIPSIVISLIVIGVSTLIVICAAWACHKSINPFKHARIDISFKK